VRRNDENDQSQRGGGDDEEAHVLEGIGTF
jgi:hypothetical protein